MPEVRHLLVLLALLPAPAAAQEVSLTVREAIDFTASTPEARAARWLSIDMESRRRFRCNAPDWPAQFRVEGRNITVTLGALRASRVRMSPCSGERMPAHASTALPTPSPGDYDLVIRYGGRTDRYRLTIAEDAIVLAARRASFTRRSTPERLARVPRDAIRVFCSFGQNRNDCAPRRPACEELFADPVLASLAPLPRPPDRYATPDFAVDLPHYLAPEVSALRARLLERYRDETMCLRIEIISGRGEWLLNR